MAFNLEDYEDVASLNKWFQDNYPMGRIELEVISDNPQLERIVIMASVFRDVADNKPAVQNIARGKQEEYNRNMARFYGEDVATSAIGRAILLLKGAERTAHKEGVARAAEAKYQPNKFEKKVAEFVPVEKPSDPWTIEQKEMPLTIEQVVESFKADGISVEEIPTCQIHKHPMRLQTGNKEGRAWGVYKCLGNWPEGKCKELVWCEIDKITGKWVKQKPRVPQTPIVEVPF